MKPSPSYRLAAFAALFLTFTGSAWAQKEKNKTLSSSDTAAIRAALERYHTGWLANDAEAVRSTFTRDAVLMPHHGLAPVIGMAAINEFWWPAGTAKTTITRFIQTVDEVGGEGKLAYVRGRGEVAWRVEDQGTVQNWRTGGNYMALFKRQADGRWLISHLIWDDPPNQQVE